MLRASTKRAWKFASFDQVHWAQFEVVMSSSYDRLLDGAKSLLMHLLCQRVLNRTSNVCTASPERWVNVNDHILQNAGWSHGILCLFKT